MRVERYRLRCVGSALGLAITLGLSVGACAGKPPSSARTPSQGALRSPVMVDDDGFAQAVVQLLRDGKPSPERSARLAGVVRRQLQHAAKLFERGEEVRGSEAVVGALYLLRAGEYRRDMFDATSVKALTGAMRRFSARGDEGRSMALMLMLRGLLPPTSSERKGLDGHLAALKRWMVETRTGGAMHKLAADERSAIARSLIEPSESSLKAAAVSIDRWIQRAVRYNLRYQETRKLPPPGEVGEAYRALQNGGKTMAALYLRHGRAQQALTAIEASAASRVTSPRFLTRLRAAAEDNTAEDWRLLARDFARLAYGDEDLRMEESLVHGALWGIALEAYRREPGSMAVGHLLADQLIELGMPEVAPLVLYDALQREPSVVSVSAVLSTVSDALVEEFERGTLEVARRIYAASGSLLAIADRAPYVRRAKPSAAQIRRVMAMTELRSGQVDAARPLLVKALQAEPSVWGYTMLGALERQVGRLDRALFHARYAADLPAARMLPLDAVEAHLLAFEILREQKSEGPAAAALEKALSAVLAVRGNGDLRHRVRAEQQLAKILDGYGESARATHAIARALDTAAGHREVLAEVMLFAVGRALVGRNITAARAALQVGMKAKVGEESMLYGALSLMLLERSLGQPSDGLVERVVADAVEREGWHGSLARWARDMIDDAALKEAAQTYEERIEAAFYLAMGKSSPSRPAARKMLASIASNPLAGKREVQLARALLGPKRPLRLPPKIQLPQ